jgi:hypothetical protein
MTRRNVDTGRERETAEARAEMLRRAELVGVRPLSFDELLGDTRDGRPGEGRR